MHALRRFTVASISGPALAAATLVTTLACDGDGPAQPDVPSLTGHWRVVEVSVNRDPAALREGHHDDEHREALREGHPDGRREGPEFDFALTRDVATVSFDGDSTVVVLNDMGLGLRHRTDATYAVRDTLFIDGRPYATTLSESELTLSRPTAFARLIRVDKAPDPDVWVETWTSVFATGTPDGARGDIAAAADGGMWLTGGRQWDLIHLEFPLEVDAEIDVQDIAPDAVAVGGNTPWCNDPRTNSLFVVDPGTGEPSSPRGTFDGPIDAIARDNSGNLWCVAAEESKLYYFDDVFSIVTQAIDLGTLINVTGAAKVGEELWLAANGVVTRFAITVDGTTRRLQAVGALRFVPGYRIVGITTRNGNVWANVSHPAADAMELQILEPNDLP